MDLTLSAREPVFARGLCQMLNNLNNGMRGTDQQAQAAIFLNANPEYRITPPGVSNPAAACFQTDDTTLLVILGAQDANSAVQVANGYFTTTQGRNPRGFNPYAEACADALISNVLIPHTTPRARLIVAGHSWGGVVGMCIVAKMAELSPARSVSICTFGSPMPGDVRVQNYMQGKDIYRCMADGDNVVFVPPPPNQAPAINALLGATWATVQSAYTQVGYGETINAQGVRTGTMLPSTTPLFTDLSIAAFLISNDVSVSQAHALTNYLTLMDAAFQAVQAATPSVGAPNGATSQPAPVANVPAPGMSGSRQSPPTTVPASVRPPVPASAPLPFSYARQNGQNVVKSGDVQIAVTNTRKGARDLAKSLNLSWKRWYRTISGDNAALTQAVQENFPS